MNKEGNKMEENNDVVQHKVVLSEYVEVTLKIPKILDVMAFKGLMDQANKMFKLAEVPLQAGTQQKNSSNSRAYSVISKTEELEMLKRFDAGEDRQKIIDDFNLRGKKHLNSRIGYLRKKHNMSNYKNSYKPQTNKNSNGVDIGHGSREPWSNKEKQKIRELVDKGLTTPSKIKDHFPGRTEKSLRHKIRDYKKGDL